MVGFVFDKAAAAARDAAAAAAARYVSPSGVVAADALAAATVAARVPVLSLDRSLTVEALAARNVALDDLAARWAAADALAAATVAARDAASDAAAVDFRERARRADAMAAARSFNAAAASAERMAAAARDAVSDAAARARWAAGVAEWEDVVAVIDRAAMPPVSAEVAAYRVALGDRGYIVDTAPMNEAAARDREILAAVVAARPAWSAWSNFRGSN